VELDPRKRHWIFDIGNLHGAAGENVKCDFLAALLQLTSSTDGIALGPVSAPADWDCISCPDTDLDYFSFQTLTPSPPVMAFSTEHKYVPHKILFKSRLVIVDSISNSILATLFAID